MHKLWKEYTHRVRFRVRSTTLQYMAGSDSSPVLYLGAESRSSDDGHTETHCLEPMALYSRENFMVSSNLTELIQCHLAIESFDYDIAIDWSLNLITNGIESENILILSSFSKPANLFEIRPYVSAALADHNFPEFTGITGKLHKARYHLIEIINDLLVRKQLKQLADLCVKLEYKYGLVPFYLLYHGWNELDDIGVNLYYEGATTSNIDQIVKKEANDWVRQFDEIQKNLPTTLDAHKQGYPH